MVAVGRERQRPPGVDPGRRVLQPQDRRRRHPGPTTVFRNNWWSYCDHTHEVSASIAEQPAPPARMLVRRGPQGARIDPRVRTGRRRRGGGGRRAERRPRATWPGTSARTSPSYSLEDAQPARSGDGPDDRGTDLPAVTDGEHLVEILGADDGEHPLLRLARHHLERLHARLAPRHLGDVDVHARAALGRGLARGARESGAAEVLHAHGQAGVEQRQARLDQPLLFERDRRPARSVASRRRLRRRRSRPTRARSRRRCRRGRSTIRAARRGCPRPSRVRAPAGRQAARRGTGR